MAMIIAALVILGIFLLLLYISHQQSSKTRHSH